MRGPQPESWCPRVTSDVQQILTRPHDVSAAGGALTDSATWLCTRERPILPFQTDFQQSGGSSPQHFVPAVIYPRVYVFYGFSFSRRNSSSLPLRRGALRRPALLSLPAATEHQLGSHPHRRDPPVGFTALREPLTCQGKGSEVRSRARQQPLFVFI